MSTRIAPVFAPITGNNTTVLSGTPSQHDEMVLDHVITVVAPKLPARQIGDSATIYSAKGLRTGVEAKCRITNKADIRRTALTYASFAGISLGNIPKTKPGGIARRGEISVRAKLQNGDDEIIQNPNTAQLPLFNAPMYLNMDTDHDQFTLSQTDPLADYLEFARPLTRMCSFEHEIMQWLCACIVYAYHTKGFSRSFLVALHVMINSVEFETKNPNCIMDPGASRDTVNYGDIVNTSIKRLPDSTWEECIDVASHILALYAQIKPTDRYMQDTNAFKQDDRNIEFIGESLGSSFLDGGAARQSEYPRSSRGEQEDRGAARQSEYSRSSREEHMSDWRSGDDGSDANRRPGGLSPRSTRGSERAGSPAGDQPGDVATPRTRLCRFMLPYVCHTCLYNVENNKQLLRSMFTRNSTSSLYVGRFARSRGHGPDAMMDIFVA